MKIFRKISHVVAYAVIVAVFCVAGSCLKPAPASGIVTGLNGKVTITEKGGSARTAAVADVIRKGDIITTGDRSQAVIEAGPDVIIKVLQDSSIRVIDPAEKGKNEISLAQGNVLLKIRAPGKGGEYRVIAGASVTSAQGAVFLVSRDPKITTITAGEGLVTVKHLKSGDSKDITPGLSADVDEKITVRPMSEVELLRLEKIKVEEFIPYAAQKGKDGLEGLRKDIKLKDEKIDLAIDEFLPMSINEIRKRYGRVDEVKLIDGTIVRGLIKWRGAEYVIITPEGRKGIPGAKVKETGLMQ